MIAINANWMKDHVHPRNKAGHKKIFGHVLVIAGSEGKFGAAILCTRAALHSGCGMVTAFIPKALETAMLVSCPEAMIIADQKISAIDLSQFDAIAIGPGIGLSIASNSILTHVIKNFTGPIVIDADALTLLANDLSVLSTNHILTPHPGEFARLQGASFDVTQRQKQVEQFVKHYPSTLVLKGVGTLVAFTNQETMINTTGNDGMATAGSGDVLTGIVASLCAQKYPKFDAACIGVYMHGFAADFAIQNQSRASLVASDIIENLQYCRVID
jgi:NAD(P)H-hydrate epimerase